MHLWGVLTSEDTISGDRFVFPIIIIGSSCLRPSSPLAPPGCAAHCA